jgi:hypothetical protein
MYNESNNSDHDSEVLPPALTDFELSSCLTPVTNMEEAEASESISSKEATAKRLDPFKP